MFLALWISVVLSSCHAWDLGSSDFEEDKPYSDAVIRISRNDLIRVQNRLLSLFRSSVIQKGNTFVINCTDDVVWLMNELNLPKPRIQWLHNDRVVRLNRRDVTVIGNGSILTISPARWGHSGVYACQLVYRGSKPLTTSLSTFVVRSLEPSLRTNTDSRVRMTCSDRMLRRFFDHLDLEWLHNGTLYTTDRVVNLTEIDFSHNGLWECRLTKVGTFTWYTNWVSVYISQGGNVWLDKITMGSEWQTRLSLLFIWVSICLSSAYMSFRLWWGTDYYLEAELPSDVYQKYARSARVPSCSEPKADPAAQPLMRGQL